MACPQPEDCGVVVSLEEVDDIVGWVNIVLGGFPPLCFLSVGSRVFASHLDVTLVTILAGYEKVVPTPGLGTDSIGNIKFESDISK